MLHNRLLWFLSFFAILWSFPLEQADACEIEYRGIINANVFMTNSATGSCSFLFVSVYTRGSSTTPHVTSGRSADYKLPFTIGDIAAPLWYFHNGYRIYQRHCINTTFISTLVVYDPKEILAFRDFMTELNTLCYTPAFW